MIEADERNCCENLSVNVRLPTNAGAYINGKNPLEEQKKELFYTGVISESNILRSFSSSYNSA